MSKSETVHFRQARVADVPDLEEARHGDSEAGRADPRMAGYLRGEHHPQQALQSRVLYLAETEKGVVGYIGGHLTERYGCDGEVQYLYVVPTHRRAGVASRLLQELFGWFETRGAVRVCVDVEPGNRGARCFYARHGASFLNPHWLIWEDIGGP